MLIYYSLVNNLQHPVCSEADTLRGPLVLHSMICRLDAQGWLSSEAQVLGLAHSARFFDGQPESAQPTQSPFQTTDKTHFLAARLSGKFAMARPGQGTRMSLNSIAVIPDRALLLDCGISGTITSLAATLG